MGLKYLLLKYVKLGSIKLFNNKMLPSIPGIDTDEKIIKYFVTIV